ncbi:ABC transporter permease [bacterium]|nr:ABC transporter permease [bacterium]
MNDTAPTPPPRRTGSSRRMNVAPFMGLLAIFAAGAALNGAMFLSLYNQLNVLGRNAIIALPAVGMTLVILAGGIDLSVGSMVSLGSVVTAMLLMGRGLNGAHLFAVPLLAVTAGLAVMKIITAVAVRPIPPQRRLPLMCAGMAAGAAAAVVPVLPMIGSGFSVVAVLICVPVAGLMLGALSGWVIATQRIQPFVVTLAMMSAAVGIAKTVAGSGGRIHPIYYDAAGASGAAAPAGFAWLNSKIAVLGTELIPVSALFFLAAVLAVHVLLTRFRFGRYIYAIGGNEEAARLSGVNVKRIKITVYAFSGWISALAGVLYCSAYAQGKPDAGATWELDAIAAVVIGGTSLNGGRGSVKSTLIGVLILGYLGNILNLQEVPGEVQDILKGVIILAAVLLQKGGLLKGFKKLQLRRKGAQ